MAKKVLHRALFYLAAALAASFFALPVLWLVTAPFSTRASLSVAIPDPPSLANFEAVFRNAFAVQALKNSLMQAGGAMILTALIATLAAFALVRAGLPGSRYLVYVLILFSSVVTGTAAMVPIFLLVSRLGLMDTHLGVIFVFTGGLLPAAIFIMRDFVEGVPVSYEEAASVCGAGPLATFRDVVMPLIRPGMVVVAVWAFVNAWGAFLIPFVLLRSPERMPASVAIYSFYTEAGTPIVTLTAAYALLYTLPVLILYLLVNWRYGFRFFGGLKR